MRFTLEFGPATSKRFKALKLKVKADNNAEVIRNALRLYEWLIEETEKGNKIGVIRGKDLVQVEIFVQEENS